jgi:hypothetical protein
MQSHEESEPTARNSSIQHKARRHATYRRDCMRKQVFFAEHQNDRFVAQHSVVNQRTEHLHRAPQLIQSAIKRRRTTATTSTAGRRVHFGYCERCGQTRCGALSGRRVCFELELHVCCGRRRSDRVIHVRRGNGRQYRAVRVERCNQHHSRRVCEQWKPFGALQFTL